MTERETLAPRVMSFLFQKLDFNSDGQLPPSLSPLPRPDTNPCLSLTTLPPPSTRTLTSTMRRRRPPRRLLLTLATETLLLQGVALAPGVRRAMVAALLRLTVVVGPLSRRRAQNMHLLLVLLMLSLSAYLLMELSRTPNHPMSWVSLA